MPRHEDDHLRMEGDDDFVLAAQDAVDHDACRLLRLHAQPRWNGILGVRMQTAAVVHAANVGVDEPGRDQRAAHARRLEIAVQGLGQGAHRELAHRVGRAARRRYVARHAAHDDEAPARLAQCADGFVKGPQHTEHIGFELPAIVRERQFLRTPNHAEARIRDDDARPQVLFRQLGYHARNVTVDRDVAGMRGCLATAPHATPRPATRAARRRRATSATRMPRRTNSRARPAPIPEDAPVISTAVSLVVVVMAGF